MSYKIIPTEHFKTQARKLQKKYPNIRNDLKELTKILKQNPRAGQALGEKPIKSDYGIQIYQKAKGVAIG